MRHAVSVKWSGLRIYAWRPALGLQEADAQDRRLCDRDARDKLPLAKRTGWRIL